jgi:hypothetical protein
MGRKAGVIALFDVDGTLTPARKVVTFYATFLSSGFGVVGFPFETIFFCRESLCGEWISRFVRSGYE